MRRVVRAVPGKPGTYGAAAPAFRGCGDCRALGRWGKRVPGEPGTYRVRRSRLPWMRGLPHIGGVGKACAGQARHLRGPPYPPSVDAGLAPHWGPPGKACAGRARHLRGPPQPPRRCGACPALGCRESVCRASPAPTGAAAAAFLRCGACPALGASEKRVPGEPGTYGGRRSRLSSMRGLPRIGVRRESLCRAGSAPTVAVAGPAARAPAPARSRR